PSPPPSVPAAAVRQMLIGRSRGHSAGEIAEALGVSRSVVRYFLGLPASELPGVLAKLDARDREAARVHALAAEGWEPAEIARRLGLSQSSVAAMLDDPNGMEDGP